MKLTNLTPFNLTWSISPATPLSSFSTIVLVNSISYNYDMLIHSIIGSGFVSTPAPAAIGAFPVGAYVLIDRDVPVTSVLGNQNPVNSIIFGLTFLPSATFRTGDLNGYVHYREPVYVQANKLISAYVMGSNTVTSDGRGLFTILAEVL